MKAYAVCDSRGICELSSSIDEEREEQLAVYSTKEYAQMVLNRWKERGKVDMTAYSIKEVTIDTE